MQKRNLFAILSILAMLLVAACSRQATTTTTQEAMPETTESSALPANNQMVSNSLILYDSYADWCSTCRANAPVIDALRVHFDGKIDIVRLNVDLPEDTPTREKYAIYDRSQYVLVDGNGEILKRWFGLLQEDQIAAELDEIVAAQG